MGLHAVEHEWHVHRFKLVYTAAATDPGGELVKNTAAGSIRLALRLRLHTDCNAVVATNNMPTKGH